MENAPTSDLQVAAHFAAKRPVLGICLKRYSVDTNGTPTRRDTFVDIPLEIALPDFITDEEQQSSGPLFGNFILSLQSVVCHRGNSVASGHYVSLVRDNANSDLASTGSFQSHLDQPADDGDDQWLCFDDLAEERVTTVDIFKALREESPYLLFYQVQPINLDIITRGECPPYSETTSDPGLELSNGMSNGVPLVEATAGTSVAEGNKGRSSLDTGNVVFNEFDLALQSLATNGIGGGSEPGGRTSTSSDRLLNGNTTDADAAKTARSQTAPPTPDGETRTSFFYTGRRSSKGTKANGKSRSTSSGQEPRIGFTVTRFASRMSREKLSAATEDADNTVAEPASADPADTTEPKSKPRKEKRRYPTIVLHAPSLTSRKPDRECTIM